uniref:Uncharacterized protein n=1 Tax=Anguilla anguilla TaxID=7936 RepID=A0A0E9W267_ANGAN
MLVTLTKNKFPIIQIGHSYNPQ